MTAITCPKCGLENPADAITCENCKVNLRYAIDPSDHLQSARQEAAQQLVGALLKGDPKRENRLVIFALFLFLVFGALWCLTSLFFTQPVSGPCAPGEVNYDTYHALAQYWTLHLILGYFLGVARIIAGARLQGRRAKILQMLLNVAIVVWVLAAVWILFLIFSRLCV